MSEALVRHDEILRTAIEAHEGHAFKTVGDAFYAAFPTAPQALSAALDAQRALHTGAAEKRAGDYFGPPLNRVARLLAVGHGGQVLMSLKELVRVEDAAN